MCGNYVGVCGGTCLCVCLRSNNLVDGEFVCLSPMLSCCFVCLFVCLFLGFSFSGRVVLFCSCKFSCVLS